jgi:hypothetical protein
MIQLKFIDLLQATTVKRTGFTAEQVQQMDIPAMRSAFSFINHSSLEIKSYYPDIGRGNVIRDRILSHKKVIQEFDKALNES